MGIGGPWQRVSSIIITWRAKGGLVPNWVLLIYTLIGWNLFSQGLLEKTVGVTQMSWKSIFRSSLSENYQAILRLLSPQPDSIVLDCGSSDGTFTLKVAQRLQTTQIYGVEFLPDQVEACQSKGIKVSSKNLNEGLDFPSDFFDVVVSNQVIEHLIETDVFVREILRVLKPGGYTVVSTNNMASWHNIIMLVLGMQPMPCHASNEVKQLGNPFKGGRFSSRGAIHWRIFSYGALYDLFEHHGFTSIQAVTSGYYPFPPTLAALLCKIDKRHGVYLIMKAYKPFSR